MDPIQKVGNWQWDAVGMLLKVETGIGPLVGDGVAEGVTAEYGGADNGLIN